MSLMESHEILLGNNTIPGANVPKEIREYIPKILQACRDYGLDFYPTIVEFLTYDEISEVAAYSGFPVRYPHWRFGQEYEELAKGFQYGQSRIFEMVIGTNPCYIYCLDSNSIIDNVTVIAHATGHNDFFKNNINFARTNKSMLNEMANHGSRIRRYMSIWGRAEVSRFINKCLILETLIDPADAWVTRKIQQQELLPKREFHFPRRLQVQHDYMEDWVNTPQFREQENERIRRDELSKRIGIFTDETKNIFGYLKDNAPLEPWQRSIAAMLYEEAMYFFPQRQTKTIHEGHACVLPSSLVVTDKGVLTAGEIVDNKLSVSISNGEKTCTVSAYYKFYQRRTIHICTDRGYEICGADNHRVLCKGEWKRLDELKEGDEVDLAIGSNLWASEPCKISFEPKKQYGWKEIVLKTGLSMDTVRRFAKGETVSKKSKLLLEEAFKDYTCITSRKDINIPEYVEEDLATFIGYLTGDGNISVVGRCIQVTKGDESLIDHVRELGKKIFGLESTKKKDEGRWYARFYSWHLEDFLVYLGLKTGKAARIKDVPWCILRSPKNIMRAFLRAYFACDGYGSNRADLSTSSPEMVKQIQIILLNFGIITRNHVGKDENWHITTSGEDTTIFAKEIGFELKRKQDALEKKKFSYEKGRCDTIVSISESVEDVVDLTVDDDSHCYVAQGFINHNSFVDSQIMARMGFADDNTIYDYARHKASVLGGKYSMNPYKLGYYLLLDIEERWNKGRHGFEYEFCEDNYQKENWDTKAGKGKEQVFFVRKFYDDILLIDEFFTADFCRKYEFFRWERKPNGDIEIVDRDYKSIKKLLKQSRINAGLPVIKLVDTNYKNKRIFLLEHQWDGRVLDVNPTIDTLVAISELWKGPAALISKDPEEKEIMFYVEDGEKKIVHLDR